MIQQTSLEAYQDIQGKIPKSRLVILNMLKSLGSANNMILSKKLGWSINRITPRILELRNAGIVEKDCLRQCPITKRITWFWRVSSGNEGHLISIKQSKNYTSVSDGKKGVYK